MGELDVLAVHLNPFDPDARLTEVRQLARSAYSPFHTRALRGEAMEGWNKPRPPEYRAASAR